ncbi:MAG: hypothetical protein WCF85_14950 [Rhodospirillaceae bacterium]
MRKNILASSAIVAIAAAALVSVLSANIAVAQTAVSQPPQSVSAPTREVNPRDLMTVRERFDMWRQMRAARTPEEKMELWAQKRAELEKRAVEKGVILREPGSRMMRNGSQENGRMGGGERRMGMTGQGGGGAHARPPMAP